MSDMKYNHFTKEERLELSILISKGYSRRGIAKALSKDHSSICRELRRNSSNGQYNPQRANQKARTKRRCSKYQGMKVQENQEIENYIEIKIKEGWSPERIAGRLFVDKGISIKPDTIYKFLYSVFGQHLCKYLKYKRYKKKKFKKIKKRKEVIKDRIFIDKRPEIINQRVRFGDFEGDTMGRPKRASSQTLVVVRERLSRKLFGIKVSQLKYTVEGFKTILESLPVLSLTLDNGVENIRYKQLNISTYFCHPYHSWEKGSVEQGIGTIRNYIPKKADLINYSDDKIQEFIEKLNNMPMKCLGYLTPNEVFEQQLQLLYNSTNIISKWCT
jgi:IS30 family transposase